MNRQRRSLASFIKLWTGQLVSSMGTGITGFIVASHLFKLTGSNNTYTFTVALTFIPSILIRPIAGVFADKYCRKSILLYADLFCSLVLALTAILFFANPNQHFLLYLCVALCSLGNGFHNPAYKAIISDVVPADKYSQASGLVQLAESSRYLLAPAAAALLHPYLEISLFLAIDSISFMIAALIILQLTIGTHSKGDAASDMISFKSAFSIYNKLKVNTPVIHLVYTITFITFCVGLFQALFGPMVLSVSSISSFGWIQSISASGMLFASFLVSSIPSQNQSKRLYYGLITAGASLMGIAWASTELMLLLVGFSFFFALPWINTSLETMIRNNLSDNEQGQSWAMISLLTQAGLVWALALAGPLSSFLSQISKLASSHTFWQCTDFLSAVQLIICLSGLGLLNIAFKLPKHRY